MKKSMLLLTLFILLSGCTKNNENTCQVRYVNANGENELVLVNSEDGFPTIDGDFEDIQGLFSDVLFENEATIDLCHNGDIIYAKQDFPNEEMYLFNITEPNVSITGSPLGSTTYVTDNGIFYFSYLANYYMGDIRIVDYSDYLNLNPNETVVQVRRGLILTSEKRLLFVDTDYLDLEYPEEIDNAYYKKFYSTEAIELAINVDKISGNYIVTTDKKIIKIAYSSLSSTIARPIDITNELEKMINATIQDFYFYHGNYYAVDTFNKIYYLESWSILDNKTDDDFTFKQVRRVDPSPTDEDTIINAIDNNLSLINIDGYLWMLNKNGELEYHAIPEGMINSTDIIIDSDYKLLYRYVLTTTNLFFHRNNDYIDVTNGLELKDDEQITKIIPVNNSFFYSFIVFTSLGRVFQSHDFSYNDRILSPLDNDEFTEIVTGYNVIDVSVWGRYIHLLTTNGCNIKYDIYSTENNIEENSTVPQHVTIYKIQYNQYTNIDEVLLELFGVGYTSYIDSTFVTEFTKIDTTTETLEIQYIYVK